MSFVLFLPSYSSCLFLLLRAYNHCLPLVSQSSFPLCTTSYWLRMEGNRDSGKKNSFAAVVLGGNQWV